MNSGRAALTISEPTTNMLVISKAENNNTEKGKNMNIRIKKYLLVGFLVLFFGAATPVAAVTETQIALTTEATNDAIVNLEAALEAGKRLAVPPTKNIPPAASCDFLIRSRYGHHIEMATAY